MNGLITYVYRCTECGQVFEQQHPFTHQPAMATCPECSGESARYFGRGAVSSDVHFKGWDWSRKDLLDPASDDPRLDPMYFDDLLEDTDRGPRSFFTTQSKKGEARE